MRVITCSGAGGVAEQRLLACGAPLHVFLRTFSVETEEFLPRTRTLLETKQQQEQATNSAMKA